MDKTVSDLIEALRKEARCRRAELDFDGDSKLEDVLEWRAAEALEQTARKLDLLIYNTTKSSV
jgi:hypothetical protein